MDAAAPERGDTRWMKDHLGTWRRVTVEAVSSEGLTVAEQAEGGGRQLVYRGVSPDRLHLTPVSDR